MGTFDSFAPAATRPLDADAFDNLAAIRQVNSPVPILHGRKDPVVPFAAAEWLRAAAGGSAVVAPIDGKAYPSIDLRYVAATVWHAFDQWER